MLSSDDVRIGTYVLGQAEAVLRVEPYRAGAVYSIDDLRPWLCVGFPTDAPARMTDRHGVGLLAKLDKVLWPPGDKLRWWRWQPFADDDRDIGRHRRYGHYVTYLHQPLKMRLECYAWPGKFFNPAQYQEMLADIEQEFGIRCTNRVLPA